MSLHGLTKQAGPLVTWTFLNIFARRFSWNGQPHPRRKNLCSYVNFFKHFIITVSSCSPHFLYLLINDDHNALILCEFWQGCKCSSLLNATHHIIFHVLSRVSRLELVDLALLPKAPLSLLCFAFVVSLVMVHDSEERHLARHRLNIGENALQLAVSAFHAAQEYHQDLMKDVAAVQRNVCDPIVLHWSSAHKTTSIVRLYRFQSYTW